jgi:hypothetical protein
MAHEITEAQIQNELAASRGDWYEAKSRLERRLELAERAVQAAKPAAKNCDAPAWIEPTADEIAAEQKLRGCTVDEAVDNLRAQKGQEQARLSEFSPEAAAEIEKARAAALAAEQHARELLIEHQSVLDGITLGVFSLGNVSKKIKTVVVLKMDDVAEAQQAKAVLDWWVQRQGMLTAQNAASFRATVEDLTFRKALNSHIAAYVAPMEKEAAELVLSIRSQAKSANVDLRKVLKMLSSDRGQRAALSRQ